MPQAGYHPPLPKITPQRCGSGFVLIDKLNTRAVIFFFVFCAFWLSISGGAFYWSIVAEAGLGNQVFIGVFVAIGVASAAFALSRLLVARKLAPPTLELAHWPVRLGVPCRIQFVRRTKDGTAFRSVHGSVALVESATYYVGTAAQTVTHSVWSAPLPTRACQGDRVQIDWEIVAPIDAPPSFDAPPISLIWQVRVVSEYDGGKDESAFTLLVLPQGVAWPTT